MFALIKKVLILVLSKISALSGNFLQNSPNCLLLKNQECKIRKVIVEYMTFPYKIKVDKCVGS